MKSDIDRLIDEARKADDEIYMLAGLFLAPAAQNEFRRLYISTRDKWIAATAEDYRARIKKITSGDKKSNEQR